MENYMLFIEKLEDQPVGKYVLTRDPNRAIGWNYVSLWTFDKRIKRRRRQ
jgi:hypothetical protein